MQCRPICQDHNVFFQYESQAADKVAHKLMSPTLSVHSETFLPLLTSIDDNMLYLTQHPEYRESAAHLTKFRACLSRALEMVRSHVRRVLDAATAAASEPTSRSSDPQPLAPSHTAFTLFYGKFRAAAPRVRGLIQEVEEREVVEYKGLLADLENHYLDCRLSLLQPSVQSAVQQLLQVRMRLCCFLFWAGVVFTLSGIISSVLQPGAHSGPHRACASWLCFPSPRL